MNSEWKIWLVVFFFLCIPYTSAYSHSQIGGLNLSLGRSMPTGNFSNQFSDGINFSIGTLFYVSIVHKYFFNEVGFTYESYSLKESSKSHLKYYSVYLEPGLFYPLWKYLIPYATVGLEESYIVFNAYTTNKKEEAFNPTLYFHSGITVPIYANFLFRFGVKYILSEISDENFSRISFSFGVTLNYPTHFWQVGKSALLNANSQLKEDVDDLYKRARTAAEAGEAEKAESLFNKILETTPQHQPSKEMLKKISDAKENYAKANELITEKKYFNAIILLENSLPYIKKASEDLATIRTKLQSDVPRLEKLGIDAYEKKEYDKCISIMNKIKIIQPNNAIVEMYLPRAIKRKEALERLK